MGLRGSVLSETGNPGGQYAKSVNLILSTVYKGLRLFYIGILEKCKKLMKKSVALCFM